MSEDEAIVETIVWYYEVGKTKSDFTKKEKMTITLPRNISTLSTLRKRVK